MAKLDAQYIRDRLEERPFISNMLHFYLDEVLAKGYTKEKNLSDPNYWRNVKVKGPEWTFGHHMALGRYGYKKETCKPSQNLENHFMRFYIDNLDNDDILIIARFTQMLDDKKETKLPKHIKDQVTKALIKARADGYVGKSKEVRREKWFAVANFFDAICKWNIKGV